MVEETSVVNIYHKVPYDIYIGRGSIWGNPFSHNPNSKAKFITETRGESLMMYREWIQTVPHLMEQLKTLDGKRLGCYCYPKECHGNILIELRKQQKALE